MNIQALKFCADAYGVHTKSQLNIEVLRQAVDPEKTGDQPCLYLVRSGDLDLLREYRDIVEDCGEKDSTIELGRYFLPVRKGSVKVWEKVPLLHGNFSASGRVTQGIKFFLKAAVIKRTGGVSLYIVGVEDAFYRDISGDGTESKHDKKTAGDDSAKEKIITSSDISDSHDSPICSYSFTRLLSSVAVPDELSGKFVGKSRDADLVRKLIIFASKAEAPVIILGETGTGKEVVARQIHDQGVRKDKPFIAVNCGAIPSELFETELFGCKKGAHNTAYRDKKGLWELAGSGTLFLDEIGDLSLEHQVKILRALQEGIIWRVGDEKEISVNARIITATNRDLFSMVKTGQFREDLFYRLHVFPVHTPVLRDHKEDIPELSHALWKEVAGKGSCVTELGKSAIQTLTLHNWPGNVRELKMILTTLGSFFRDKKSLNEKHIKAVFELQGIILPEKRKTKKTASEDKVAAESHRYLRRAERIIESIKQAGIPMEGSRKLDSTLLKRLDAVISYHLEHIEILCQLPLLFHSQSTFDSMNNLRSKILYFNSLLHDNPGEARTHWLKSVKKEFDRTIKVINKEIDSILNNALV